jgi:hypothetical protein
MKTNPHALIIDDLVIPVQIDPVHEYTLTTAEVAAGYGVDPANIRKTLERHRDELFEGKHFSSVTNSHAGNLQRITTIWTKRGIIRLGFFIRSERAKRFRDMAEDLVIAHSDTKSTGHTLPEIILEKIQSFTLGVNGDADQLAQLVDIYKGLSSPRPVAPKPPLFKTTLVPQDSFSQFLAEFYENRSPEHHPVSFTVAEIIAAGAPVTAKDPAKACGHRLTRLANQPFRPYGTGTPLIIRKHRHSHQRFYIIRRPELPDMAN